MVLTVTVEPGVDGPLSADAVPASASPPPVIASAMALPATNFLTCILFPLLFMLDEEPLPVRFSCPDIEGRSRMTRPL